MSHPLTGCSVLVTRPAHQAGELAARIEAAGGCALRFPLLAIEPLAGALENCLARIAQTDFLLFVSANAVDHLLPALLSAHPLPCGLQLGAVGRPTAARIAHYGCPVALCPAHRFDSEGLLELPALQAVEGRRVLIARGEGGREMLAETLRARGARVDYLEVYRRVCPQVNLAEHPWAERGEVDVILLTSPESLENLLAILREPPWLKDKTLLVIGERLKQLAEEQGFSRVLAAAEMSDAGLFKTLLAYWETL